MSSRASSRASSSPRVSTLAVERRQIATPRAMSGAQPAASQAKVFAGVASGLAIAAMPFAFKEVRAREQAVAEARDSAYDAKDEARNARLSRK